MPYRFLVPNDRQEQTVGLLVNSGEVRPTTRLIAWRGGGERNGRGSRSSRAKPDSDNGDADGDDDSRATHGSAPIPPFDACILADDLMNALTRDSEILGDLRERKAG
jgi:hypothetical protein